MSLYPPTLKIRKEGEWVDRPIDEFIKMRDKFEVVIGIPYSGDVKPRFAQSLADTMAVTYREWEELGNKEPLSMRCCWWPGSMLPKQRSDIARMALNRDMTHLLFIDTDMLWNPYAVARALHWRLPILAANCVTKVFPPTPTAATLDNKRRYTTADDFGLEQVLKVGTGWMLIDCDVLRKMTMPYFNFKYRVDMPDDEWLGEDFYFCEKAMREAQAPVVIDHDISKTVNHIGEHYYSQQMNWKLLDIEKLPDPKEHALYRMCMENPE